MLRATGNAFKEAVPEVLPKTGYLVDEVELIPLRGDTVMARSRTTKVASAKC